MATHRTIANAPTYTSVAVTGPVALMLLSVVGNGDVLGNLKAVQKLSQYYPIAPERIDEGRVRYPLPPKG